VIPPCGGDLVRAFAPAGVIVAVVAADIAAGQGQVVLGLTVIAPLMAANLLGPAFTAVYGLLALLTAALLGVWNDQYLPPQRAAHTVHLGAVAAGSALAVTNAGYRQRREQRLAQVTRVAEVAQRAILPPVPACLGPVDLAVRYESATSEATVGGDLYAALPTPFGVRLLVGDVRGKGLEAVLLASHLLAAFRERADERQDLAALLADLDRTARRVAGDEDFVTAVLAQVTDDHRLTVTNAGHPPPLLVRGGAAVPLSAPETRRRWGWAGPHGPLPSGWIRRTDCCSTPTGSLRPAVQPTARSSPPRM